jgi:hypothetical protein
MDRLAAAREHARMIAPGQTLENPVTGERFTFTHTAASTGGELLAFDFALRPGGAVPIPHVHPIQTERFEVLAGRMRFRVGLRTRVAGRATSSRSTPASCTRSRTRATGGAAARRGPARAAMEEMLAEVVAMARAGRMTRRGLPRNPLELAALARRYDREAHAPLLGVGVQRVLLAPLVLSARHPRAGLAAALVGPSGSARSRERRRAAGLHVVPAVHRPDLAGDVARGVGGQEVHDPRDLLRVPEAPHRHLRADPVEHLLRHRGQHVGLDEAGGDRVDRDADLVALELVGAA